MSMSLIQSVEGLKKKVGFADLEWVLDCNPEICLSIQLAVSLMAFRLKTVTLLCF